MLFAGGVIDVFDFFLLGGDTKRAKRRERDERNYGWVSRD